MRFSLKRSFLSALIFCFSLHGAPAWAQNPLLSAPVSPSSTSLQVGIAAAVLGKVEIQQTGVGRVLSSGQPIFLGDVIKTDGESRLQVLLRDETVFTVGPDSEITIDEFVYDPATDEGNVKASAAKGLFRLVTGKIARKKPENVKVKLPTGTIGIRGTIVLFEADPKESLAVLFGPGAKNNTPNRDGRFILGPDDAVDEQDFEKRGTSVDKTGSGVTIDALGNISDVFEVPEDVMGRINKSLSPAKPPASKSKTSGAQGGGNQNQKKGAGAKGPSATEQAGQDGVETGEKSGEAGGLLGALGDLDSGLADAVQDEADTTLGTVPDGPTTFNQLLAEAEQNQGTFHYSSTGNTLVGTGGGDYDLKFNINFGDREIGGGTSNLTINNSQIFAAGSNTVNIALGQKSFDMQSDNPAEIGFDFMQAGVMCSPNCKIDLDVSFENQNGTTAALANHAVEITNPMFPSVKSNGSGQDSIQDGAAP